MSDTVIKIESLSKSFTLRHQRGGRARYVALRDVLTNAAASLFRNKDEENASQEEFWALKNVSFSIKQGESVGIIGRNGAGKSTLLKILSRITEPTSGRIEIEGRVASLLEVGTGFHPELTGRENIYLNGAILGMKRTEIKKKFDEIVAFAEVEKFLDTPVKHFSSGMYMRLAFAVAAHLQSEILIVDEVLAVGDAEFQRKCLGKMNEVSQQGRTVLFVSHNMQAMESLTTRCVFLSRGQMSFDGPSRDAISLYLKAKPLEHKGNMESWPVRHGSGGARVLTLAVENAKGEVQDAFRPGEQIHFRIGLRMDTETTFGVQIVIENEKEESLFTTLLSDSLKLIRKAGYSEFSVTVDRNYLLPGNYSVSIVIVRPELSDCFDSAHHVPAFTIEGEGMKWRVPLEKRWGNLYFPCKWELIK